MKRPWIGRYRESGRRIATIASASSLIPRGCRDKVKFKDYRSAVETASEYNERVALQFGKFGPYWCRKHRAWHVGHYGKRDAILKVIPA